MNDRDDIEKRYSNGDITVTWRPHLCNHSTICFMELPGVFKPSRRPWVKMDEASTDEIIRVVEMCPTRALTWERDTALKDTTEDKKAPPDTTVRIVKNGPALIRGNFKLIQPNGSEKEMKTPVALCRCGLSKKAPLCDGSHLGHSFDDEK